MIVGFDYWNVISHYPEQMAMLADSLHYNGANIHVISAVGVSRVGTVADEVRKHWTMFPPELIHEVVFEEPEQSPELKLAKCQELGITLFFDDRQDVCDLLNANGILALTVPRLHKSTDVEGEQK